MDTAVAFVQAYLRVDGCFTVSEYPVVERLGADDVRTMTDLDILCFRLPAAGRVAHAATEARIRGLSVRARFEAPFPVLVL